MSYANHVRARKDCTIKGRCDSGKRYYTPEVVLFNGSACTCISDTPNPAGEFDLIYWDIDVKGLDYVEPSE